jgi:dTDP-4-dehydrorhamnose reductase
MNKPGEFNGQLAELTAQLTGMVAERLAAWSKDMDPGERHRILEMIEGQLPDIVINTIAKSPSLHSASGVKYLEENLENWADSWAKRFIGKD